LSGLVKSITNTVILADAQELISELPDNSIDFIFTDPPYGHHNNNGDLISRWEAAFAGGDYVPERDNRPILCDGKEANELFQVILPEFYRVLKPGSCCCCCCCGGGGPDPQFARWTMWMDAIFSFKQMVVWDKGPMGMGHHYRRSYETVLVGMKRGAACKWFDTTKRVENIIRHIPKIIPSKNQHPTEKPVALAAHFINLHSRHGDLILDPFCGSGSTLIAARSGARRFIGVELDPYWHKRALERLSQETELLPIFQKSEDEYETDTLFRLDCGKTGGGL